MTDHEWARAAMWETLEIDIDNPDDSDEPGYSLPQDENFDIMLKKELFNRWKNAPENEQEILVYRYGLSNGIIHSEAQTAELYGISGKEVRRMEFRVFGHRQRSCNAEKLREYIGELRKEKEKKSKKGWKYQW